MKKLLVLLLILAMTLTTAACSSKQGEPAKPDGSGTAENGSQSDVPRTVPNTKLPMPDSQSDVKCTGAEFKEGADADEFDLQVTVSYGSPEDALTAYADYFYRMQQIHNYRDSDGNRVRFLCVPEELDTGSSSFTFNVWYADSPKNPDNRKESGNVSEEDVKNYAGKWLAVEMTSEEKDYTDFLKTSWESRTFYEYLDIHEDGSVSLYVFQNGDKTCSYSGSFQSLASEATFEDNRITLRTEDSTIVFERNDEIPD